VWVVDDPKSIVVTRVCLCVCLSAAVRRHYCTDPDVTWGHGRGCPLVVHYWADLQSGQACVHLAIWRHSANGRLGGVCSRCWPLTGGWWGAFSKLRGVYGKWAWLARRWLAVDGGHSQHYWRPGLRASSDGVLATKSECKMLASTCLYSLYAWFVIITGWKKFHCGCLSRAAFLYSSGHPHVLLWHLGL